MPPKAVACWARIDDEPLQCEYVNWLFDGGKPVRVIEGPYELADAPEAFRLFALAITGAGS